MEPVRNMDVDNSDTSPEDNCKQKQNYNFRRSSVIKRICVEEKQKLPKGTKLKHKSKPQPLSKYRRKSANARERTRINDMNEAYEQLRLALPQMTVSDNKSKLSKQTILSLALNYIVALRGILGYQSGLNSDGDSSNSSSSTGICSSEEESNSCSSSGYSSDQQNH